MTFEGTTITDLEALVDKHRGCYGSGEPTADDPVSVPEPDYRDAPTLEQRAASFLEFEQMLCEVMADWETERQIKLMSGGGPVGEA